MQFINSIQCRVIAFFQFLVLASLLQLLVPFTGRAQDTSYAPIDAQIPGPAKPADRQAWLDDLRHWRRERLDRIGFNDANYRRPELAWTQRNFVCAQMMIEERGFYDRQRSTYTVDHYLDGLQKEFGGVDSVLIWDTYPNLGVDNRNQFDRLRDMPGGLAAVRQMVADFHRRGVKVLFPETPWDFGTRDEGRKDWFALADLMQQVGADGLLGDTMDGMPHAYLAASEAVQHPLALQPEGLPPEEALAWNEMTWGYWSYPLIPMISRYKWMEPRHMPVLVSSGRQHIDGIQAAFFNGVGYSDQEDVIGIHNGFTVRDKEALRRVMLIDRAFAPLLVSPDWQPHAPTLHDGVFASRFPGSDQTLWTVINRNEYAVSGNQLELPATPSARYFDLWHGIEIRPSARSSGSVTLNFDLEPRGFGAILELDSQEDPAKLSTLLGKLHELSAKPLADFSEAWHVLPQQLIETPPARISQRTHDGMVLIPAAIFNFEVHGIEVNNHNELGMDVQYPWEDAPHRDHSHVISIRSFYIDRYPVTNEEFKRFLDATHYHPRDGHNFLRDWQEGAYPAGWDRKPVTWVSLEDARAYASWTGKRLPNEWEWQYAAQGLDGRLFPWGSQWDPEAVPATDKGRLLTGPSPVDAHSRGASPFGVFDMVGNVWQWTNEFQDEHTRSAVLRGGSYYQPQGSMWYFPQAYRLDEHGKYLLMAPSIDRSGTIGFRCAADAD